MVMVSTEVVNVAEASTGKPPIVAPLGVTYVKVPASAPELKAATAIPAKTTLLRVIFLTCIPPSFAIQIGSKSIRSRAVLTVEQAGCHRKSAIY
jgi:hypothetical protein